MILTKTSLGKRASQCVLLFAGVVIGATTAAQDRTPLEEFRNGFPMELQQKTRSASYGELFRGGDVSAYFISRVAEFLNTAVLPSRHPAMLLGSNPMPEIGQIEVETKQGKKLTLDEYLAQPDLYAQGFLVVYKGDIVYEKYPRMRQEDAHLWMSNAKPTASLVIDILIDEGKIDESLPVSKYITDWKGTDWDGVAVRDVLDMVSGMDLDDTASTRFDPNNIATRVYQAELKFPHPVTGEIELLTDVLKSTKAKGKPGERFEYSSALTQVLVLLAEAVETERWHQIFDRLVWSKIGAEGPLQLHLTPDGIAAAHGLVSSNLRDMARFGMLYTPSWNKIAVEQVVTDEILERTQKGVREKHVFMDGAGSRFIKYLGTDDAIGNSRQWDLLWADGDMWKGGLMTQGLYVSPSRDLVIAYFSVDNDNHAGHRFPRPVATSGLFDK